MFFFHSESFADITFDIRYFELEIQIQTLTLLITWHYVTCTTDYSTTPLAVTLLKYETKPQNEH